MSLNPNTINQSCLPVSDIINAHGPERKSFLFYLLVISSMLMGLRVKKSFLVYLLVISSMFMGQRVR